MKVPSFTYAGGVVSPGLYGRVDLNKYQTGLKVSHNQIVGVEGGSYKRWGTYFVGKPKYQDKATRIVRWRIANDDSYLIEFGENYMRFVRFGGFVSIPGGHVHDPDNMAANVDGVMELETPYTAEEIAELKFTFANDLMYIFAPQRFIRVVSRLGLYDWKIEQLNFDPHPAWIGAITLAYHDDTTPDDNYDAEPVPTEYKVSATLANGIETKASPATSVNADLGHRRTRVDISWPAYPGAIQYTIYKGKNGIFGFIGYSETTSYVDRNYAPSYDIVPLGKAAATWGLNNFPRVGEFYKQRMVLASTLTETQALWLSRPLIFNSLLTSIPSQDDDAIKVELVRRDRHTIHHMLELKKFIIFTDTAEWVLGTVGEAAMSPATIDPVPETAYGCDPYLVPIPIGNRIIFVQNGTGDIRDLGYEFTSDTYAADDLSRLSRHLFKNQRIVAWAYAAYPNNLLHTVTSNGALRTLTYVREHEIWGWATAETQGRYLDVAAVPEITHDGAYFLIRREIDGVEETYIERTEVNLTGRIEDMVYVDCALTFREEHVYEDLYVENPAEISFKIEGMAYELDMIFLLENVHIDDNSIEVLDQSLRVKIISLLSNDRVLALILPGQDTDPADLALSGRALRCGTRVTGFDHLVGAEEVWLLADGKVLKNQVVDAEGGIDLPFAAARIHGGLPFFSAVETLDLDTPDAAGTYNYRAVNDIAIRLENSRGVWAGSATSPRDLVLIPPRSDEDYDSPNRPLDGPYIIPSHASWDLTCRVRLESRDPLPLNVLNIIPDLVYGT